ncbi:MAG: undecaprenyldiphospho-muramoylpentapeptide beta-N-acetylglucosaminyltransferase [Erysipelotrichaceae bacterium]|jgi:UDP-N-acetylglucosamine--N-acetylmuramyl-(pentapeptide) pyrophosphoryl-undecaprenol N-acetylglucosamine transferase
MKIVIATGGTGGHIYPATTLADKLIIDDRNNDILFIGNHDRMEANEIPKLGYRFIGIKADSLVFNKNKINFVKILYRAYKECIHILEDYKPDIVLGFGGYVTVPVVMAAVKLKIKTIIHEQNSLPGLANRTLGHFVDRVVVCYESAKQAFKKKKTVLLGNPRETAALNFVKDPAIFKQFGLDCSKKTVLFVMGSLGSASVNEKMMGILEGLKHKDFNVIYVTGKRNYQKVIENISESDNLKIVDFIDQFNIAGNCDLVVSRAGATSASEYMSLGIPTIIIPSPYVTNNHQYMNAKEMFDKGASFLLEEKDLNVNNTVSIIEKLINDDEKLQEMSVAARKMSHTNAAYDIISLMKEVTGKNNG